MFTQVVVDSGYVPDILIKELIKAMRGKAKHRIGTHSKANLLGKTSLSENKQHKTTQCKEVIQSKAEQGGSKLLNVISNTMWCHSMQVNAKNPS